MKKINKAIIYGCGDMGIQTYNILKHNPSVDVIGFLDDNKTNSSFLNLPVVGDLNNIDNIKEIHNVTHGIVTIGDNKIRRQKTEALINKGLKILTAIHPQAFTDNVMEIGSGTIVEMGAFIHPETTVGKGCFICSGSIIAHNSIVDDYSLIAGGVVFGSRVIIGSQSLIGVGANISPYVSIGENVIVGTGAAVITNIPDNVIVAGVPAKVLRKNPNI